MLKVTYSCTLNFSLPFWTSTRALLVAKNGLPSMIGISLSSSISKIMKSAENMNFSTLINTSSIMPLGCLKDRSASCKVTISNLAFPNPSFLNMEGGIKLMLAPYHKCLLQHIIPNRAWDCETYHILELWW